MKLVADLLSMQDPERPHTLLTRFIVSFIIVVTSVIYTGFFGVLGLVAVYLIGVELMNLDLRWIFAPVGLSIIVGLKQSYSGLVDYWQRYGHGIK